MSLLITKEAPITLSAAEDERLLAVARRNNSSALSQRISTACDLGATQVLGVVSVLLGGAEYAALSLFERCKKVDNTAQKGKVADAVILSGKAFFRATANQCQNIFCSRVSPFSEHTVKIHQQ